MFTEAIELNLRARPQEPPSDYLRRMRAAISSALEGIEPSMVVKLAINRRTIREAGFLLAQLPRDIRYQVVANEASTLRMFRDLFAPADGRRNEWEGRL